MNYRAVGLVSLMLGSMSWGATLLADVKLPNIFSDHMVLQRGQSNRIWGKADAGEQVRVEIANQMLQVTADGNGDWHVMLDPLPTDKPLQLKVKGKNELVVNDVLVGEVWICSGQSNMQWAVQSSNDADLEKLAAKYPGIRMINFPQVGTQDSIWSHDQRRWAVCTPESVPGFSAVGYFFARQLHETLGVPIGMINNAWGGSACEAWIARSHFEKDAKYQPLLDAWAEKEKRFVELTAKTEATEEEKKQLENLKRELAGNQRPANIYHGVLKSHLGYGIKGAIWYQGESNAGRAYQYRHLFPLMIQSWREEWGQGDFPFYWVQLADFRSEVTEPKESDWAELREAQTMTMSLANTGQAVIIDIGEGKDIHPMNKVDVARRLARWALAKDYQVPIAYRSPEYKEMEVVEGKVRLTFDHVELKNGQKTGWRPFDVNEPRGFAIAGEDKKFVWANAKILGDDRIEVWSDAVPAPVAVRYGWADNPVCNMFSIGGLPLTPFRTDDWPGVTAGRDR